MKKYFVFYFPILDLTLNWLSWNPAWKTINLKYEYSKEGKCQVKGKKVYH